MENVCAEREKKLRGSGWDEDWVGLGLGWSFDSLNFSLKKKNKQICKDDW